MLLAGGQCCDGPWRLPVRETFGGGRGRMRRSPRGDENVVGSGRPGKAKRSFEEGGDDERPFVVADVPFDERPSRTNV